MSQTKAQLIEGLNINTSAPADALVIDSSGRVGIGDSSPSNKLVVKDGGSPTIEINGQGRAASLTLGVTASESKLFEGSNNALAFGTNNTERMRVTSAGRLGIGTTSPSYLLTALAGSGSQNIFQAGQTSVSNGYTISSDGSALTHQWYTASGESARIDSSGRLLLGTTTEGKSGADEFTVATSSNTGITIRSGTSSTGDIMFSDGTSGDDEFRGIVRYDHSNNSMQLWSNASERLRIDSSGNVAIGTESADRRLHVKSTNGTVAHFESSNANTIAQVVFEGNGVSTPPILGAVGENLHFTTGNIERMRINSSGKLLLGTTTVYTPSGGGSTPVTVVDGGNHRANLVISNQTNHADAGAAVILAAHGQDWQLEATSVLKGNRDFTIKAGTNERLRLDNSGRFLYGTSTGVNLNNASGGSAREAKAYIYNTASVTSERYNLGLVTGNNGVAGPTVFLSKTRASSNTHTVVQSGDEVGDIRFSGSDGTFFVEAAKIRGIVDGTPGSQDMPGRLEFHTTADGASSTTERMRIDSSGRVGIKNTSPGSQYFNDLVIGDGSGDHGITLHTSTTGSSAIAFSDATSGSGRYAGYLQYDHTSNSMRFYTNGGNERARFTSGGYLKASNDATYNDANAGAYHEFVQTSTSVNMLFRTTRSNTAATQVQFGVDRAATSAYWFVQGVSSWTGSADTEFYIRGDGNAFADGTWTGGGADYAEYFEWSDGNTEAADRRGISVVLDGDKIREAVDGEEPIGVISGNPSVVGDGDVDRWKGKYLRDDYGSYVLDEDGYRQLNPDYDSSVEYVQREDRPEWDTVGLMGKLRIRKGQVTGTRWIKMRDVSDTVEEWLVR